MNLSHKKLVKLGAKWLSQKNPIVVTELATIGEEADAIAWSGSVSVMLEAKISRSDFLADRDKEHRRHSQLGVGDYRYFIAPKGLIKVDELPDRWGLLEVCDKGRVWKKEAARLFTETNKRHEIEMLMSVIRRIGQHQPEGVSIKAYYLTSENRTELFLDLEEGTNE